MGKGERDQRENNHSQAKEEACESAVLRYYTWSQIKDARNKWIVINDTVYDISKFYKKHPGGERLMLNHVGQDVTDAFTAFHIDAKKVNKYLKTMEVGKLSPLQESDEALSAEEGQKKSKKTQIEKSFRSLRQLAEKMNLFKTDPTFFILQFAHIILMEIIAVVLMRYSGYQSWLSYMISALLMTTVSAQAAWLQHDFGHLSVFNTSKKNHWVQMFLLDFTMGFPSEWWNYRHYQHHAKPNIVRKDPDIRFGKMFMLGKTLPREYGEKKIGTWPYTLQQFYFFFIVPPLLMTVYFLFETYYFLIKTKNMFELFLTSLFFVKWFAAFGPSLGFGGSVVFFFLVRFLYSHWFTYVTQMNHIPMAVERDAEEDWVTGQLQSTCNVDQSWFNDWFTGHLNFQIEHHLFPTMPRHNYHKVAPLVKKLCKEHGIDYVQKTLSGAMGDIFYSLKESGELWYDAYNN